MTYLTNADIEERVGSAAYVQLTDDDGDGVADVGVVDEARVGATGEVDSYLARRYRLPIDQSLHADLIGVLKTISLHLAEYRLRLRRPPVSKDMLAKYAQAVQWLSRVADGTIELPSATPIARAIGKTAESFGEDRLLSRDELAGF